jgi:hypothetical protein
VLGLQYESNTSTQDALLGAVIGASRAEAEKQPDAWGVADKQQQHQKDGEVGKGDTVIVSNKEKEEAPPQVPRQPSPQKPQSTAVEETPSLNWDAYGGRNISSEKAENAGQEEDIQGIYMSLRAKERAEKRRSEDELKSNEQRERAAQRLRELDQKASIDSGDKKLWRELSTSEDPPSPSNRAVVHTSEQPRQRTLFDPNKPYSAMTGGGSSRASETDVRASDVEMSRNGRTMSGPPAEPQNFGDSRGPQFGRQPMIQLSSYEDRDRGERGSNAGPRMLYDPKSGSMVAVPSREDGAGGRGRKERGKKARYPRDKDSKVDSKIDNEGTKSSRRGKARRDDSTYQRGKAVPETSSPVKLDSKRGRASTERKLPRTCGVLYANEAKGHFYCVDGSDGDLGYGTHSVPGGKTRNPEAFDKYVKDKTEIPTSSPQEEPKQPEGPPRQEISYKDTLMQGDSTPATSPGIPLQTGFNPPESTAAGTATESSLDWIKPNEKIMLMTGVEDSPTLQATAKEWAPSHAAFTAAAFVASMPTPEETTETAEEDDDAPVSIELLRLSCIIRFNIPFLTSSILQLGLGFDPTLHMDSMMQSPSAEPRSHLEPVDFTTLSLEPAIQTTAQNTHNIFAFESGATWGSSNAGGHNDWGIPSSVGNAFASSESNNVVSTSFLSLSKSNGWSGVPGISGSNLGGSPLSEQTGSTGE